MNNKIKDFAILLCIILTFIFFITVINFDPIPNSRMTVIPRYPTTQTDYHVEVLGVIYPKNNVIELSEKDESLIHSLNDANFEITNDLYGGKKYIAPTKIELTGEIKDGKTYFYYDGYVTTSEGEYQDYNEVIVCDFVLNSKVFDWQLKERK